MQRQDFTDALGSLASDHRLFYYEVTDSTNTRALDAIAAGTARPGDIFIAGRQTAGRGTAGKTWNSDEPLGLWMTLLFADPPPVTPLSFLPGVALATLLRTQEGVLAHLKWPNDVLVGRGSSTRKIAGILIEGRIGPAGHLWAIGVGVNLNQPSFDAPLDTIGTSLRLETGRHTGVAQFFGRFLKTVTSLRGASCDLPSRWTELSRLPGRTVQLKRKTGNETVRVKGANADGSLLVVHTDGRPEILIGVEGVGIDMCY